MVIFLKRIGLMVGKNIDPFESYRALFNGDVIASSNPELIFTRAQNVGSEDIRTMVAHQLPRVASGWNNTWHDSETM